MKSAMGKWISTTCCACLASNTDLMSNGFNWDIRLLHHHGAFHLGMEGAKVGICPRFVEGRRKLLVGVERLGLDGLVVGDNGVGNIVTIGPRHLRSHSHGD